MFVPSDVQWFIAEQVQELRVEGQDTSLVYINSILVKADTEESAFNHAVELSRHLNHEYENTNGAKVRSVFRGLSDLNPVHDKLEDGAELWFYSRDEQTEEQIAAMVQTKEKLFGEGTE